MPEYEYFERIELDGLLPEGERWFFRKSGPQGQEFIEHYLDDGDTPEWVTSAHSAGFSGWPFEEDDFLKNHVPVDASEIPEELKK